MGEEVKTWDGLSISPLAFLLWVREVGAESLVLRSPTGQAEPDEGIGDTVTFRPLPRDTCSVKAARDLSPSGLKAKQT